jgi:hypothetical protein
MVRELKYAAVALVLALPGVVCAQQSTGQGTGSTAAGGEVAARVGDRVITLKEVDEAWKKADPVEHTRATQMLYEGRKETVERIVADILIEQAAKSKGSTPATRPPAGSSRSPTTP